MKKLLALVLLACVVSAPAQTITTNNFGADFTTTTNVNGNWSYRYRVGLIRDGVYPVMPNVTNEYKGFTGTNVGFSAWYDDSDVYDRPTIGANKTAAPIAYPIQASPFRYVLQPNQAVLMPAVQEWTGEAGTKLAVVQWTAPYKTTINLSYQFTDIDPSLYDGVYWYVDKGSSALNLDRGYVYNPPIPDSGLRRINGLPVEAGDVINFVIHPGSYGWWDSTLVYIQITFPSTLSTVPRPLMSSWLNVGRKN